MAELIVLALALLLIVLGARGTYQSVWNSVFPNYPIQVATVTAAASPSSSTSSPKKTTGGSNTTTTQKKTTGGSNTSNITSTSQLGSNPLPGYHGSNF